MKGATVPEYFRCRTPFAAPSGDSMVVTGSGTIVTDDDWRYKASPHSFVALSETVETATQAPGERRNVRVPRTSQGRNPAMPHRTPLPPEHPDSPASPEAPNQPHGGFVAPDVPDHQNPAKGPKGGPRQAQKPGTADHEKTGEGWAHVTPATSVSEFADDVDQKQVQTAIKSAMDGTPANDETVVDGAKASPAKKAGDK